MTRRADRAFELAMLNGYSTDHSAHNLFTSILQACGSSANHFGNNDAVYQGPLPDLL